MCEFAYEYLLQFESGIVIIFGVEFFVLEGHIFKYNESQWEDKTLRIENYFGDKFPISFLYFKTMSCVVIKKKLYSIMFISFSILYSFSFNIDLK